MKVEFSDKAIDELKDIIIWAISEGYMTNNVTNEIIYKLNIDRDTLEFLDENCNTGIKILK